MIPSIWNAPAAPWKKLIAYAEDRAFTRKNPRESALFDSVCVLLNAKGGGYTMPKQPAWIRAMEGRT